MPAKTACPNARPTPAPVIPPETVNRKAVATFQHGFVDGFLNLSPVAGRLVANPNPLSLVVNSACAAAAKQHDPGSNIETDESFSPMEEALADALLAIMATAERKKLRISQCVAARLAQFAKI